MLASWFRQLNKYQQLNIESDLENLPKKENKTKKKISHRHFHDEIYWKREARMYETLHVYKTTRKKKTYWHFAYSLRDCDVFVLFCFALLCFCVVTCHCIFVKMKMNEFKLDVVKHELNKKEKKKKIGQWQEATTNKSSNNHNQKRLLDLSV